jgi:hypothetical protein
MMRIWFAMSVLCAGAVCAQTYRFQIDRAGEAVADLVLSSPGADWARAGREAAMADVRVDDGPPFQLMLYAGEAVRKYSVFLGHLGPGQHRIVIERNRTYSASGAALRVASVSVRGGIDDPVIARAPVLYARKNTIGKFTDVPMLVYAEKLNEGGTEFLQYTVIFSNEDGGTSTRALMARWGRTHDVEYVYRLDVKTGRAIIQGRGHKDIEYRGKLEGAHPLLIPVTDNNMVGDEVPSEVRYQMAPVLVDLSQHSREQVIDEDPAAYLVMAKELEREGKLRPFGIVDEHKVSDPRNYLYIEAKVGVVSAGVVALARRKDDGVWRTSALGRSDYAVDRSGWIRTTIELPPGTRAQDLGEIGFGCVVVPGEDKKLPLTGSCRVESVSKIFLLDREYRPGASAWTLREPVDIPAGIVKTYKL